MNKCLLCHESIAVHFGWRELLGLGDTDKVVCHACHVQFSKIGGELCEMCGRDWLEVPKEHRHGKVCSDCEKWEERPDYKGVLKLNRSVYHYNSFMKEVLASYKFRGDAVIANVFQKELQRLHRLHGDKQIVVPIPLSEERLYERGFNQSLLLAQQLNVEIVEALAKSDTVKQSKKGRSDRVKGENNFHVVLPETVKGEDIVLMDDIYTTGTTIRMAAKRLKEAGAKEISSITLVRS